ncbi:MAG: hypothetical protein VCC20_09990 [Myxococcota bacterium]
MESLEPHSNSPASRCDGVFEPDRALIDHDPIRDPWLFEQHPGDPLSAGEYAENGLRLVLLRLTCLIPRRLERGEGPEVVGTEPGLEHGLVEDEQRELELTEERRGFVQLDVRLVRPQPRSPRRGIRAQPAGM